MAGKKNAAPKSETLDKTRTPKGVASWAFLDEPQEDLNGKSQFKITLFFDKNDAEWKDFVKKINSYRKEAAEKLGVKKAADVASPVKTVDAKLIEKMDGKIEITKGQPYIEFKTNAKDGKIIKVVGADAKTEIDPGDVWAGSLCRVSAGASGWSFGGKAGVKFYLNAVQALELVNEQGGGLDVFEDESSEYDSDDSEELEDEGEEFEEEEGEEFEEEDEEEDLL